MLCLKLRAVRLQGAGYHGRSPLVTSETTPGAANGRTVRASLSVHAFDARVFQVKQGRLADLDAGQSAGSRSMRSDFREPGASTGLVELGAGGAADADSSDDLAVNAYR